MRSFVKALIGILVTFYVGIIYGSAAITSLGFAEAIFVVLSFISLLVMKGKTNPTMQIPLSLAEQGQEIRVILSDGSKSIVKPGRVKYLVVVQNPVEEKKKKKWLPMNMDYYYNVEDPGRYEFKLLKVRIYDWSGLFWVQKKVETTQFVQVNPKIYSANIRVSERVRNFFGDADVYDDFRPGYDPSELFGVREFKNGDKLQSVHWKLSAKTEDLMVKENSLPKAPAVTILSNGMKKGKSREEKIAFLQVLVSLSFSLMDKGCPHYICWYSRTRGDLVRARVDDEEGFYLFLSYYLTDYSDTGLDTWDLYQEKYRAEKILDVLEITGDLNLLKNHKLIQKIQPGKVKQEMETLEIEL